MILLNTGENNWYTYPSLSLGYIAGALSDAGHRVIVVDLQIEDSPLIAIKKAIEEGERHLGVTVNAANVSRTAELIAQIRNLYPELKLIAGGPQASAIPGTLLECGFDAVVVGEGEPVICRIAAGEPPENIQGVFCPEKLRTASEERVPHIQDLDSVPWPAWESFQLDKYYFPGHRPAVPITTSRGCPFNCINCTKFLHGYKVRRRSITDVVDEMENAVDRWGIREFHFWDDHFTYDTDRVCQLCEEILERNLQKKMRFALPNGIRADVREEEMLDMLVKAGLYAASVSVESGSQKVVDKLGKKIDLSVVLGTVEALRERNVRVALYFMMGLPFETLDDLNATIRMACSLPAHHAHFFIATPFPGTRLYELAREHGQLLRPPNELSTYDEAGPYMSSPHWTSNQLRAKRREAFRRFYTNPQHLLDIASALVTEPQDWGFLVQNAWRIFLTGSRV
ncbi:MAG: B12-binding domain-containing radical SAM protein [Candidatus Brocadiia bacterium]